MKIAFYNKKGMFASKYENLTSPKFNGKDLMFDQVSFYSLNDNYVLLADDVDPPNVITDASSLDLKNSIPVEKTQDELIAERDKRIAYLEDALLAVLDLLP
jgi:hypothetical protein